MGVVGGGWVQGALWRFESSVCKEGEREGLFLGTGACTFSNGTSSLGRADEQVASSSSNWPGHLQPNLGQIGLYSLVLIGILIVLEIVFRCPRFHYAHRCGLDNILVLLNGGIPIAMPTVTLVIRAQQLAKYQVIVTGITAIEERAGRIMRSSDTSRTRTTNKLTIDKSTLKTYSSYSPEEVSLYAAYASRTENMDAIDTCRIVLSERGLSTIVRAIRQSRVIFQRVRNYSICTRAVTIRIVIGFAVMAFSFKFDFPPFMVLIIALLNDATIMTLSLDGVVPSSTFDSWDLGEIITYAFAYGLYLAAGTIAFYCVIIYTTLFTDKFGVNDITDQGRGRPRDHLPPGRPDLAGPHLHHPLARLLLHGAPVGRPLPRVLPRPAHLVDHRRLRRLGLHLGSRRLRWLDRHYLGLEHRRLVLPGRLRQVRRLEPRIRTQCRHQSHYSNRTSFLRPDERAVGLGRKVNVVLPPVHVESLCSVKQHGILSPSHLLRDESSC